MVLTTSFPGNGENLNRKTVQPRSPSDGYADQKLFTFEGEQTSSKQVYGTPMKTLLAKEMLNEISAKKRTPSLIAKLMGLDGLPSPRPIYRHQRKLSDNSKKSTDSVEDKRNKSSFSHQLDKKSTKEQQYFKDVYEDPEASHVGNQLYASPTTAKRRSTKQELEYIQERCDEMLRESIAIKHKLGRVDSNSDFMLNCHKLDSLYGKCLHDQRDGPSVSPCNQITLLKPSSYGRQGAHVKGLKQERETLRYHAPAPRQRTEDRKIGYCHNANNSRRSSRNQLERMDTVTISPTRIVVLKTNIARIYNDNISSHSPDAHRKSTDSELFGIEIGRGEFEMYKGPPCDARSSWHKSREAREIARKITSQMKEGFEGGHVRLSRDYAGNESLYSFASESEMFEVSSRNSFDRSGRPRHSLSNMSESDVIREAKKRMSKRWKTHGYKDARMVGKGSTLEEMLSDPSDELRHGKTGCVAGQVVGYEYASPARMGISSKDCRRVADLRNTSRSRSLPPSSRNRTHISREYYEGDADEKTVIHNEPLRGGKSKGVKQNFDHIEDLGFKNSRYSTRSQSSEHCNACSSEFEIVLLESHYNRKPTDTYFENEYPVEHESRIFDIYGATPNTASVIDEFRVSSQSSNEPIPGPVTCKLGDANSYAADEDSSNSQESSTAKSLDTVLTQLSGPEPESSEGSKEVDEHGQVSVSDVLPIEDVSSGSDCFESVSSQLHELRKQLQLLKMDSGSPDDSPNDEEIEHGSFFTISESNNWKSTYLTDFLQNSCLYDHDPYTFLTTWYSVDTPTDPLLFDHLEKRYSQDSIVSRCERRLFYDRINEALFDISKTMVSYLWVNPAQRGIQMTLTEMGFEDQLQKVLAKKEKESSGEFEDISIDNDLDWYQPVKEIDVVGKQIADALVNELVLEIVTV